MIENCSCHINPPCYECANGFLCENCDETFNGEYLELYKGLALCPSCYAKVED